MLIANVFYGEDASLGCWGFTGFPLEDEWTRKDMLETDLMQFYELVG